MNKNKSKLEPLSQFFDSSVANKMRALTLIVWLYLLGAVLISGCATSGPSARSGQDDQSDTTTRLAAVQIRLEKVDEKIAVIHAYVTGKYTVRAGDTAAAITELLDLPLTDLKKLNPTVQWNRLRVGQRIKITENNQ